MWLRQSTASQEVLLGPFLDDTDGKTPETALTIANTDIKIWKEGATTEANKTSGGATHIAAGRYYAVLDATDTNTLGKLEINIDVAGALPVRREYMVLSAIVYDSLVLGTDTLQVDMTQIGGATQSATDLKDFADDGYDPATNKVQGVVLVDTASTVTDGAKDATVAKDSTVAKETTLTNRTLLAASYFDAATDQVTVATNNDKTGYALTQAFPSNFADMAITLTTGQVTIGTNNDKTGYTASTVTDKTGYSISGAKTTLDALNDVSAADVNAQCDQALLDYDGPTSTEMTAAFTEIKGATWSVTDTLEAIRDRGDAAWVTGNTVAPDNASIALILADTNELQTDWADGGRLDLILDAINANVAILTDGVIKANTAGAFHVQMIDVSGDPVASQAVTITRRLDNGAFAAASGTASNTDANGVTYVSYAAADVNGTDAVAFKFSATGAKDTYVFAKLSV